MVISDNAKMFKGASKVLTKPSSNPEVIAHLSKNRIEWRFNLERAPSWSGSYERMIESVKQCLRNVLGNAKLKFD